MEKSRMLETSLVLTTAFIVVFLISDQQVFIYIAAGIGFTGVFIRPLALLIAKGWFVFAEVLNLVVSEIILGSLFFLLLTPVSLFYRLFHRDKLLLRRNANSTWRIRERTYNDVDLKNIW